MKRLLIGMGTMLAVIVLIGGVFWLKNKLNKPQNQTNNNPTPNQLPNPSTPPSNQASYEANGLPSSNQNTVSAISDLSVLAYHPKTDGSVLVIDNKGEIWQVSGQEKKSLGKEDFKDVFLGSFSNTGNYALVGKGNRTNAEYHLLNTRVGSWQTLESNISSPVWSYGSEDKLIYFRTKTNSSELVLLDLTNPKKNTSQVLSKINQTGLFINWPSPNHLVASESPSANTNTSIWDFNLKDKTWRLMGEGMGLMGLWNSGLDQGVVFEAARARGGQLWLWNETLKPVRQFSFFTLPNKCAFAFVSSTNPTTSTKTTSAEYLWCGVPRESLGQEFLPDSYLKRDLFTTDKIYQIDLRGGEISILNNNTNYDVSNLKIIGGYLYFINRTDHRLYRLDGLGSFDYND